MARPSALWRFCLRQTARGVLIGAAAGAVVGGIEAYRLLTTARAARAALHEAAVYAVVVDALLLAVAGGIAAAFLAFLAAAIFSAARSRAGADNSGGSPPGERAAAEQAATAGRPAGRRTLVAAAVTMLSLLAVLPAQVLIEALSAKRPGARGSRGAGANTGADVETLGAQAALSGASGPGGRRPNVVLITIDALRADHLHDGGDGAFDVATPNLDRLVSQGTLFSQAHVHQPQTNPSFSSLFTGLWPTTHGVRAHMTDRLPASLPTLATLLGRAGYTTAGIAPWTSLKPAFSGLNQGFDTYLAAALGEPGFLQNPVLEGAAGVYRRIKDQLWVGRRLAALWGADEALEQEIDGRADVSTAEAIAWLDGRPAEPFFLWVHYFDPHYPWTPPAPYDTRYDPDYVPSPEDVYDGSWRTIHAYFAAMSGVAGQWAPQPRDIQHLLALYAGEVSFADDQIGRLLDHLAQRGLIDNTLFVVTADHGESFGEHDDWLHGNALYEQHELRVPLFFVGPGIPQGRRVDRLVRQIDILPTIFDLLGLPLPVRVDGHSLLPLIQGNEDNAERTTFGQVADDSKLAVVTDDFWKLILDYPARRMELYYLPDDPHELENRAERDRARVAALFGHIDRWAESERMHWLKQPENRFGL